jgi:hypothetical protein
MSIISKIVGQPNTTPVVDANQLTKDELEFLLNSLKDVTIVGLQVEMFYNLILKLQNQYVEQTK